MATIPITPCTDPDAQAWCLPVSSPDWNLPMTLPGYPRANVPRRQWRQWLGVLVAALSVAGCAVEFRNAQPAQELARLAQPPGSAYLGWRVYQEKCATCHGPTANGTPGAPDLLPIVRVMGPRQFIGLVLTRYDWGQPAGSASGDRMARESLVDRMAQGREEPLTMPAWGSEPRVNAHIVDLYAYLSARAQGLQGPDRPPP